MNKTMYEKIWDSHLVVEVDGQAPLIYVDRHLMHEVTSPQAFEGQTERYAIHTVFWRRWITVFQPKTAICQ